MGPCTANARRPTVDSRCRGTTISCCVADLRHCLPTTLVTGVQQSTRYCGALPYRHLCMMTPSLYVTRSATSSQCRSSCKMAVRMSRIQWLTSLGIGTPRAINREQLTVLQSLTQIARKLRTGGGASEVTTLWRYTNLFIIIIIFFIYTPGSKDPRG